MTATLSIVDYVVFALLLIVSAAIGIYYGCTGGKQKTAKEFLMADRQMGVLPVTLSLLASFMSAITLLGVPAEMYQFGTHYWTLIFAFLITMTITSVVLLPIFYRMKVTSVYEYLGTRFSRINRVLCSLMFIIQMSIYMGIVFYVPSLALEAVAGLKWEISVCLMGVVCCFYTVFGGMKAVMWTDAFQIAVMFAGMIGVIIRGSMLLGGFAAIWEASYRSNRIDFLNISPHPFTRHTIWSTIIGGAFVWLPIYAINQSQVQRYCATPTMRRAQLALWLNIPGLWALITLCCMSGMIVYAYYENCDPLLTKRIKAADQILPLFVMDTLSFLPGFAGLFTATVFSGSLSTVSSGVNSIAAVVLEDFVKVFPSKIAFFHQMSDERSGSVSKAIAIAFSFVAVAIAFLASVMGDSIQAALGLFGMIGGPIFGVFMLGMLFPFVNWIGALIGHIVGTLFTLWIGFGQQVYKPSYPKPPVSIADCAAFNVTVPETYYAHVNISASTPHAYEGLQLYRVSYMWFGLIGTLTTILVGVVASLATGANKGKKVDPSLLFEFSAPLCTWPRCFTMKAHQDNTELRKSTSSSGSENDRTETETKGNSQEPCFKNANIMIASNSDSAQMQADISGPMHLGRNVKVYAI